MHSLKSQQQLQARWNAFAREDAIRLFEQVLYLIGKNAYDAWVDSLPEMATWNERIKQAQSKLAEIGAGGDLPVGIAPSIADQRPTP